MHFRRSPHRLRVRHAAVLAAGFLSLSAAAHGADPAQAYRFEVINQPVAVGAHSELEVKVTSVATGRPVENVRIMRSALEMTMPGRAHKGPPAGSTTRMGGETKVVGTTTTGTYRLLGDVSMPGTWKLDIVASVPGEAQPVESTVTFKAGRD